MIHKSSILENISISRIFRFPSILIRDLKAASGSPILVAGLPRSGSSWVGDVLATGESVRYFREPFNAKWQRYAEPFQFRYLKSGTCDSNFDAYCMAAFEGRIGGPFTEKHRWERYRQYPWWPGRILVKEVHAILALEKIEALLTPQVVVIVRHPCALAASWRRLDAKRPDDPMWRDPRAHIETILSQDELVADHLAAFVDHIRGADTYLSQVGMLWGAVYRVLTEQAASRPHWTVVTHEALSRNPNTEFSSVFESVNLIQTPLTTSVLNQTAKNHVDTPFSTSRISSKEVGKWRDELSSEEASEIMKAASPFGVGLYSGLGA